MRRLPNELMKLVGKYNELRFSHWTKADRKHRKKQVVRLLKRATDSERDKYAKDVKEFLRTNGYHDQQHQG